MNVLLSAYACNPAAGGESNFGFHWAWETARLGNRVWCLTQSENRADIEDHLAKHADLMPAGAALEVVYLDAPSWANYLYRWQFGVYLHYLVWQRLAWRYARQLGQAVVFDYVHHATYGSLQMGTQLWRLGRPLVFGPVGGAQRAPRAFRRYIPDWFKSETMRDAISWLLLAAERNGRRAARKAALVLATNSETAALAQRLGSHCTELFLDTGLPEEFFAAAYPERPPSATLRILWLARLVPRKGLPLVLDALSQVAERVPFHLTIIGDGPLGPQVAGWLQQYGLADRATWRGAVPWAGVREAMRSHDVFLFGSLRDSFAAQFLEAMASGLPIITLDHQGAHDFIPAAAGVKVPVTTPAATTAALARAVERCYDDAAARRQMGQHGYAFARTQTWPRRAQQLQLRLHELLGLPLPGSPAIVTEAGQLASSVLTS